MTDTAHLPPAAGGPTLGRRDLLVGGLMAATGAVAWARTPRERLMAIGDGELEKLIPLRIGGWSFATESGVILPPPDSLSAQLYDQQLTRSYESDDPAVPAVMLVIAYGSSQSGMLQVHRPEVCYPAGGFQLSETQPVAVPVRGGAVPAMTFTASRELRTERVLYWTRIGNEMPRSWTEQRLAVIRANLNRTIPDGVLVRMSTISGDARDSPRALDTFAELRVDRSSAKARRLRIGDGTGIRAG